MNAIRPYQDCPSENLQNRHHAVGFVFTSAALKALVDSE
jgi:hypothetical protein